MTPSQLDDSAWSDTPIQAQFVITAVITGTNSRRCSNSPGTKKPRFSEVFFMRPRGLEPSTR